MARLFIAALTAATMLLPGAFRQAAHAAEPEFTFSLNLAIPPTHQRWTQAIKPWVEEIEKRGASKSNPISPGLSAASRKSWNPSATALRTWANPPMR